jgi:hypothetical protein
VKPAAASGSGRLRDGLEAWLVERPGLPQPVVEHARVLASQLDVAPDDSPLHGRYTAVLGQLLSAAEVPSVEAEVAALQRELFG